MWATLQASDVFLGVGIACVPLLAGFVAWVAKTLLTASTELSSLDRRVSRLEDEVWPVPTREVGTRSTIHREIVVDRTPEGEK